MIGSVDVVSLPVCIFFTQTGHFTQTCHLLCKKKTLSHTATEKLMLPKKCLFDNTEWALLTVMLLARQLNSAQLQF